jgi:hypothetical protein
LGGNGAIQGAAMATNSQKPMIPQPASAVLLRPICHSHPNRALVGWDGSNSVASTTSLTPGASAD